MKILHSTQPIQGLGDIVERLAKPVAVSLKLPCLDENKKLRPESPCAKRRDALNRLLPLPRQVARDPAIPRSLDHG